MTSAYRRLIFVCALVMVAGLAGPAGFAQSPQQPLNNQPVTAASASCIAVKSIGSHAFRNIMLAGVAGALISKQQYEVVSAVNYPARVGQKFHGNDLQTISGHRNESCDT